MNNTRRKRIQALKAKIADLDALRAEIAASLEEIISDPIDLTCGLDEACA